MIFKPKIKQVLQYLSISVIALTLALSINTIQTHANDAGELNAFLGKSSSAESTGQGAGGSTDKIQHGVSRAKTGYMAYMLTTEGQRASDKAVAFKSPNFNYHTSASDTTWVAKSRLGGYSVGSFDGGVAPWSCNPWEGNGSPTNEPRIKEYMLTKVNGIENTATFINKYFGYDAAVAYGKKEAILVIETLLHFQFSKSGSGDTSNVIANKTELLSDLNKKLDELLVISIHDVDAFTDYLEGYGLNSWAKHLNDISHILGAYKQQAGDTHSKLVSELKTRIKEVEAMEEGSGGRVFVGPPLVGTVPELVRVKTNYSPQPGVFDYYINGAACEAEYMTAGGLGEQAGFKPWDGTTRNGRYHESYGNNLLTNEQVTNLAVAMMVFTAQTDTQTTCDEPQRPAPHKAPVESTGNVTIIKNYRTKDGTQLTDDGCFVTQNVSSDITIESEGKYQVVGWATSSSTSTIDSITWSVPSPITQGTTPTTITLEGTEKSLYVLLEKTEDTPEPPAEPYNYKLTESSITRRVHFTAPDHRLTLPYIENHTFKWIIPAHQTSCPGNHPFTDACHGQHSGPHTASCEKGCPATCTQEHPSGSDVVP